MTTATAPVPSPIPTPSQRPPIIVKKGGWGGRIALGFWILAGLGLAYYLVSAWNPALVARYGPLYLKGLWTTVSLVCISFFLGAIVSVPIAFGRMSTNALARSASFGFIYFFRGTPLIAQIFLVYYGFGEFRGFFETIGLSWFLGPEFESFNLWSFFRDAWYCAIFAISLNSAAYQAEILRGAIQSVARGQWEGARSLGLSPVVIFVKVVLPQAMIVALRPYANEIILMIKASAIVAIITVYDLFGETRRAYSRSFDFQTYIWAALFYLAIVEVLRNLTAIAETRLIRHLKR